jgi:hypothetical protein
MRYPSRDIQINNRCGYNITITLTYIRLSGTTFNYLGYTP